MVNTHSLECACRANPLAFDFSPVCITIIILGSCCLLLYPILIYLGVFAVPIPPVNITATRTCPLPWKLSWDRSTGLEWNLTHFEVLLHAVGSATEDAVTVAVVTQEQGHYEVFLPQLNVSEVYQLQVRSVGQEGPGNYSNLIVYTPQRCGEYYVHCCHGAVHTNLYCVPTSVSHANLV